MKAARSDSDKKNKLQVDSNSEMKAVVKTTVDGVKNHL